MSMPQFLAGLRGQADLAGADKAVPRLGKVTSYDLNNYTVKVALQPDGTLTNWMPLQSPWVGNGWGLFCAPNVGDLVEVGFIQGDPEAPFAKMRFFNDQAVPMPVPAGEFWLVHASGSKLKFTNDGNVYLNAKAGQQLNLDAPQGQVNITSLNGAVNVQAQGGTATVNAQTTNVTGVTVNVTATGNATVAATGTLNLTGSIINLN